MEIEPNSRSNSRALVDHLQDQKSTISLFISQNESEWEGILQNLAVSKEEFSFELLEYGLNEMRTRNPNRFVKLFKKDSLQSLLNTSENFEHQALILEAISLLQDNSLQNFAFQTLNLELRLTNFRDNNRLNALLFIEFYDYYIKNRSIQEESFLRLVESYQRRVSKTFAFIFQPLYDSLKSKELILEPLMVWMLILSHKQNNPDYKLVIDIAKIIKGSLVKKNFWGMGSEIDQDAFYKVMMFGFTAINQEYSEKELIRPDLNFCVLFEMLDEFKMLLTKKIDLFCVLLETENDVKNIIGNLVEASYSQNMLIFLEIVTKYFISLQRFETLFYILKNVVLKKMLNKLSSPKYFEKTLDILKHYLFGFARYYSLSYEKGNTLLKNYKLIFRHQKHNLQKFYEFSMCLYHLYKEFKHSGDFSEMFDSLRRIKENNDLEGLLQETYNNYKIYSFELQPKGAVMLSSLFEKHGLSTPRTIKNFKGLQNLGNTCYMNSLLQSLFMTVKFRKQILSLTPSNDQTLLISELCRLFSNLYNLEYSQERYLVPVEMKSALPEPFCSSYQQQDACEFSRLLLEEIENQLNKIDKTKNVINSLFYGKVKNTIKCHDCNSSFSRNEDLMDIPLSFAEEALLDPETSTYDLQKMILYYFSSEEFSHENSFYCDKCKGKSSKAIKESLIIKLPPILILSINRFRYEKNEGIKKKLFKTVKPYDFFNLKTIFTDLPGNAKDYEYYLYGIIVHSGFGSETGHYFSINKDTSDDSWYIFNDTVVRFIGKSLNLDEILLDQETPYMFFYANKSESALNLNYTERKSLRQSNIGSQFNSNSSMSMSQLNSNSSTSRMI